MAVYLELENSSAGSNSTVVRSVNFAEAQVELVKDFVDKKISGWGWVEETPKTVETHFKAMIRMCLKLEDEKWVDFLIETNPLLAQHYSKERANIFSYGIDRLIEKGLHAKASDLYRAAIGGGVWNDFPAEKTAIEQKLSQVGFKF